MKWCGTRKAEKLLNSLSDVVVFDLETTGRSRQKSEILQIAICDGNGCLLFSSYVKPKCKSWKHAEKVNGISPEMVADAPTFAKIRPEIQRIFNGAKIVAGYNCNGFDIPIIERYGITLPLQRFDVMSEYRAYHPIGRYRLKDCAEYCGVSFSPHDAVNDACATAACMKALLEMPEFIKSKPKAVQHNEVENHNHDVESIENKKQNKKRPISGRLFGFLFRTHSPHMVLSGLFLMIVGVGTLYYKQGGGFLNVNKEMLDPQALFNTALSRPILAFISLLVPIGAFQAILGIIKSVKAIVLRVINVFRKLFD